LKRFARLLRRGLSQPKRRIATKPSGASVRRRLAAKKRRSQRKKLRGRVSQETDRQRLEPAV
jgi:ribosome-associated protein